MAISAFKSLQIDNFFQEEVHSSGGSVDFLQKENAKLRASIQHLESELVSLKSELVIKHSEARYREVMHKSSMEQCKLLEEEYNAKIAKLKKQSEQQKEEQLATIQTLEAKVRLREKQLFGKKSEKSKKSAKVSDDSKKSDKKKKGQRKGSKGHGRKKQPKLPKTDEFIELSNEAQLCSSCSEPYQEINRTEDSEIVEVKVKAHTRVIRRKCYKRGCQCNKSPIIITAPTAPRLIWKSPFGASVWIELLLGKYWFGLPLNRIIQNFASIGLDMAPGTIMGGFYQLEKFLRPIYDAIVKVNVKEKQWNADETRWSVFEPVEGKGNYRWYLWVFKGIKTVVFLLDPSRATKVIQGHLSNSAKGTIICDRYSAYKCFARISGGRIVLAFCWSHVRRDFIDLAKKYPLHEAWGIAWVKQISTLFHLNKSRLQYNKNTVKFSAADQLLRQTIKEFKESAQLELEKLKEIEAQGGQKRKKGKKQTAKKSLKEDLQIEEKELEVSDSHDPRILVLTSLMNHWDGLIIFVDNPEIPMDNNSGERILRGPVVGRKNYYGSGSKRSAHFSTMMFTIIHTLLLNNINPRKWFSWFFEVCMLQQDAILPNISQFLPWNLTQEDIVKLAIGEKDDVFFDSS